MTAIVKTAFHEPRPQPELRGELGLTSQDVADSLGVQHSHLKQAIRDLARVDETFVDSRRKVTGTGGRARELVILPVDFAKILVAQYKSKVGIGYVRFLLGCERVATQDVPKLRELLEELKGRFEALNEDNSRLRTENQVIAKALPKASVKREKRYRVPVLYGNMFGDGMQVRYELRTQKECKEWQWAVGMLPMLVHLRQSLGEKIVISKKEVVDHIMANLTPQEFGGSREEVEAALARFTSQDDLGTVCN